jgi:DNA-binding MarR family transcriptional regulator
MQNFAEAVLQLREWERSHFPKEAWRVSSEVIIAIAAFHLANKPLSIKGLQGLLPYSPRSIKTAIDQLLDDGWCELSFAIPDRRVKSIRGTPKLFTLLDMYEVKFKLIASSAKKICDEKNSK